MTRAVRNRDIPLLTDVLCIMQEVVMIESRMGWQRERMTSMNQRITGMPGSGGLPKGLEEAFAILSELEENQEKKCLEYSERLKEAQAILDGIENTQMKTFVEMKYIINASDQEIRKELNLSRRFFDEARKRIEEAPNMRSVRWPEKYVYEPEKGEKSKMC